MTLGLYQPVQYNYFAFMGYLCMDKCEEIKVGNISSLALSWPVEHVL